MSAMVLRFGRLAEHSRRARLKEIVHLSGIQKLRQDERVVWLLVGVRILVVSGTVVLLTFFSIGE